MLDLCGQLRLGCDRDRLSLPRRGIADNVPPMPTELSRLQGLGNELTRRARAAGVLLIWRAQERSVRRTVVRDGRPESTGVIAVSGHGIQVVTPEGRTALGSRDDFREGAGPRVARSSDRDGGARPAARPRTPVATGTGPGSRGTTVTTPPRFARSDWIVSPCDWRSWRPN